MLYIFLGRITAMSPAYKIVWRIKPCQELGNLYLTTVPFHFYRKLSNVFLLELCLSLALLSFISFLLLKSPGTQMRIEHWRLFYSCKRKYIHGPVWNHWAHFSRDSRHNKFLIFIWVKKWHFCAFIVPSRRSFLFAVRSCVNGAKLNSRDSFKCSSTAIAIDIGRNKAQ